MRELIPAVGLVLAGALVTWQQPGASAPEVGAPDGAGASRQAAAVATDDRRSAASTPVGAPRTIRIPVIDVVAPVDPVSVDGTVLDPPADPSRAGWWANGQRPRSRHGAVVVTGHTVHGGGGVFDDLDTVVPGDPVTVDGSRGATTYVVASVETISRVELARRSSDLLGPRGPHRLVLVTCEDWDGSSYRSSVVVVARRA